MKNPESLGYYMFATNFFFVFTFINEEYFNSSYPVIILVCAIGANLSAMAHENMT